MYDMYSCIYHTYTCTFVHVIRYMYNARTYFFAERERETERETERERERARERKRDRERERERERERSIDVRHVDTPGHRLITGPGLHLLREVRGRLPGFRRARPAWGGIARISSRLDAGPGTSLPKGSK